jgi:two-component system cell cycle response regulator
MAYQKVLIVDDSKMVRTAIGRVIRDTFEVREEVDGEGGWNAIDGDSQVVAVITDIQMPVLDGFGLLARIRSSTVPRVRDLPVIIISGNKDDEMKKRARAAGANDFITKGSDGAEIVARIDNLLSLVQAKNDLQALKLSDVDEIWDPLTGTFRGDYLFTEGAKHFSHARRHSTALSVVTFRIENYADIERRTGKELTGQLLARVAKLVQGTLRAEDSIGRTADAQFSMIFPSTSAEQALVFARRLKDQLENARVRHNDQVIKLTTYIGIASLSHDKVDSFDELAKAALARLDRAAKSAAQAIDQTGRFNVPDGVNVSVTIPPSAPSNNIAYILKALENASVERTREVLKQMLPFMRAAFRRLNIEFPGDAIARELDKK